MEEEACTLLAITAVSSVASVIPGLHGRKALDRFLTTFGGIFMVPKRRRGLWNHPSSTL